jgi:hypothetical protein
VEVSRAEFDALVRQVRRIDGGHHMGLTHRQGATRGQQALAERKLYLSGSASGPYLSGKPDPADWDDVTARTVQVVGLDGVAESVGRQAVSLFVLATQTGNTAGVETDLQTYTLPANTVSGDGDALMFYGAGLFGAVASADKRLRVKFGGTTIFDSGALAITSQDWMLEGWIVRTELAAQKCITRVTNQSTTIAFAPVDYITTAIAWSADAILKVTGAGTNANDVVAEFFGGHFWPGS